MIYTFLALNKPIGGEALVVEGWLPDNVLKDALSLFRKQRYKLLITTGGTLQRGSYLVQYNNWAEVAASTLMAMGLERHRIIAVPAPEVAMDRTYASALALKKWLVKVKSPISALDIYSLGPHARRTRFLFRKALGNEVHVGILAARPYGYDPAYWWQYSNGVATVLSEGIAYLYSKFFFRA